MASVINLFCFHFSAKFKISTKKPPFLKYSENHHPFSCSRVTFSLKYLGQRLIALSYDVPGLVVPRHTQVISGSTILRQEIDGGRIYKTAFQSVGVGGLLAALE